MTSPQVSSSLHPSVGEARAGLLLHQVLYPFSAGLVREGGRSWSYPPQGSYSFRTQGSCWDAVGSMFSYFACCWDKIPGKKQPKEERVNLVSEFIHPREDMVIGSTF